MQPKLNVSLVIVTLNEADGIERCLKSVPWVNDVVVVDSGSTDATVEIAQKNGARVFVEKWRGYRAQKERATELAKNDWVLSLDGDEALSSEASIELYEFIKDWPSLAAPGGSHSTDEFDGLQMPRVSFHLGKWIRRGGWYPDWQLRFYHRARAKWVGGDVHEHVEAARTRKMRAPIQHWPWPDLAGQVATNNHYSTLGMRDLQKRGKRFSREKLVLKPISKFIECFILKRGFLDGLPGFIIAVGAAYSVFLKFAKLWEAERVAGPQN